MSFAREKQELRLATVRFWSFICGLLSRRAPVAAATLLTPAPSPLDPETAALLAEVEALDTTPTPAPLPPADHSQCVNLNHLSGDEFAAALDALFPDAIDTSVGAKIATKSNDENLAKAQAARAFPAIYLRGCLVRGYTPSTHTPSPSLTTSLADRVRASQPSPLAHLFGRPEKPFTLPTITPSSTWSRSTAADKFDQAIRSSQTRNGVAITVNLSPAREKALRASADPVKLLATYLNRALGGTAAHEPCYAFQFELSPTGRLHIHGVVCLEQGTPAELEALKAALAIACGKIKGRAGSRQVTIKELYSAEGWISYFSKTTERTVELLGTSKVQFVSRELHRLAEDDWLARPRTVLARAA
jgi:hypothetical protein